jgi:hypothetical protein
VASCFQHAYPFDFSADTGPCHNPCLCDLLPCLATLEVCRVSPAAAEVFRVVLERVLEPLTPSLRQREGFWLSPRCWGVAGCLPVRAVSAARRDIVDRLNVGTTDCGSALYKFALKWRNRRRLFTSCFCFTLLAVLISGSYFYLYNILPSHCCYSLTCHILGTALNASEQMRQSTPVHRNA